MLEDLGAHMGNIHGLLARRYVVPILRELSKKSMPFKTIAYGMVKNTATASKTLKDLQDAGMVRKKGRDYEITRNGKSALSYANNAPDLPLQKEGNDT